MGCQAQAACHQQLTVYWAVPRLQASCLLLAALVPDRTGLQQKSRLFNLGRCQIGCMRPPSMSLEVIESKQTVSIA